MGVINQLIARRVGGIGAGWSPISGEGFVDITKVEAGSLLVYSSDNFVGYSYEDMELISVVRLYDFYWPWLNTTCATCHLWQPG